MNSKYLFKKPYLSPFLKSHGSNLYFSQSVIVVGAKSVKYEFYNLLCQVHKQSTIE